MGPFRVPVQDHSAPLLVLKNMAAATGGGVRIEEGLVTGLPAAMDHYCWGNVLMEKDWRIHAQIMPAEMLLAGQSPGLQVCTSVPCSQPGLETAKMA